MFIVPVATTQRRPAAPSRRMEATELLGCGVVGRKTLQFQRTGSNQNLTNSLQSSLLRGGVGEGGGGGGGSSLPPMGPQSSSSSFLPFGREEVLETNNNNKQYARNGYTSNAFAPAPPPFVVFQQQQQQQFQQIQNLTSSLATANNNGFNLASTSMIVTPRGQIEMIQQRTRRFRGERPLEGRKRESRRQQQQQQQLQLDDETNNLSSSSSSYILNEPDYQGSSLSSSGRGGGGGITAKGELFQAPPPTSPTAAGAAGYGLLRHDRMPHISSQFLSSNNNDTLPPSPLSKDDSLVNANGTFIRSISLVRRRLAMRSEDGPRIRPNGQLASSREEIDEKASGSRRGSRPRGGGARRGEGEEEEDEANETYYEEDETLQGIAEEEDGGGMIRRRETRGGAAAGGGIQKNRRRRYDDEEEEASDGETNSETKTSSSTSKPSATSNNSSNSSSSSTRLKSSRGVEFAKPATSSRFSPSKPTTATTARTPSKPSTDPLARSPSTLQRSQSKRGLINNPKSPHQKNNGGEEEEDFSVVVGGAESSNPGVEPPPTDDVTNISLPTEKMEMKIRTALLKHGNSDDMQQKSEIARKTTIRRGLEDGCGLFVTTNDNLRKAFKSAGFVEIPQGIDDDGWVIKFVTNHNDINYRMLHSWQLVNHFERSAIELGSKVGLLRNLRSLQWLDKIDVSRFVPRTYNLQNPWEIQNFIDDFITTEAQSILLRHEEGESSIPLGVLQLATQMIQKVLKKYQNPSTFDPLGSPMVNFEIADYYRLRPDMWMNHSMSGSCPEAAEPSKREGEGEGEGVGEGEDVEMGIKKAAQEALDALRLKKHLKFDGKCNAWICKPGHGSRGRGIRVFNDLSEILKYQQSRKSSTICQKYLEAPLLLDDRKFDIRIWVMVTSWNPLSVFFFNPWYIRICTVPFNLDKFYEIYAHLCNRCVQTKSGMYDGEGGEGSGGEEEGGHMWDAFAFKAHLQKLHGGRNVFDEEVFPRMRSVIVNTLHAVQDEMECCDRKNSFEWFGFDLMIDEDLNCWLVEVNISPDTACVTDVLSSVVPAAASNLVDLFLSPTPPSPSDLSLSPANDDPTYQWNLLFKGKTFTKNIFRARSSVKKLKAAECRSGRPYSTREALIAKIGAQFYTKLVGNNNGE